MEIEFNTKTENIKSGTLVKFSDKGRLPVHYAIYLTNIDGKNPILYDLYDDKYYTNIDMYDIYVMNENVRLIIE